MNKNCPLVSIIIVNFNGKNLLKECLESLQKIKYENYELIIVDNQSLDGSVEFIKHNYPSVRLIELKKNFGFAYPNNFASKQAHGDFLLFLNNDTIVTPEFLSELIKQMQKESDVGICQSLLLKPNGDIDSSGDFVDSLGICYSSKTNVNKVTEILSAKGASMLIRKEIFKKLNGFDEKFFISFEDVDLGWRTWIIGYRVVLVPSSIVYHYGSSTINKINSGIAFHGFKNQLSMKLTNFEFPLSIKAILGFFWVYGYRILKIYLEYKFKGYTTLTATKYEDKIAKEPDPITITKSIWWIIMHASYIIHKKTWLSKNRVFSSKFLKEKKILT